MQRRFRLDVRTRQEVIQIDRAGKSVTVRNHADGTTYEQRYSKLILATGAQPIVPPIPGVEAANVLTLRNLAGYGSHRRGHPGGPDSAKLSSSGPDLSGWRWWSS